MDSFDVMGKWLSDGKGFLIVTCAFFAVMLFISRLAWLSHKREVKRVVEDYKRAHSHEELEKAHNTHKSDTHFELKCIRESVSEIVESVQDVKEVVIKQGAELAHLTGRPAPNPPSRQRKPRPNMGTG